jgi:hypothetical protein
MNMLSCMYELAVDFERTFYSLSLSVLIRTSQDLFVVCFSGSVAQRGLWPPRTTRILDHTRSVTVGRTPLDK